MNDRPPCGSTHAALRPPERRRGAAQLHEVAYDGKGLGDLLLCPEDRIDVIDKPLMKKFMEDWYRPERRVIAGAGVEHETLLRYVEKHFAHLKDRPTQPQTGVDAHELQKGLGQGRSTAPVSALLKSSSPSLAKSLTRAASSYLYYPEKPLDPNPAQVLPSSQRELMASLQVLVHGRKIPVSEMCDKIDAVDIGTIRTVAARLFAPGNKTAKPTVLVMSHEDVGDYAGVLRKYGLAA